MIRYSIPAIYRNTVALSFFRVGHLFPFSLLVYSLTKRTEMTRYGNPNQFTELLLH
jgi:hypothetical protein